MYGNYETSGKYHEAAFDAYITGVSYLRLKSFIEAQEGNAELVRAMENKIFLFQSDIPLSIDSHDVMPSKPKLLRVKNFDSGTKTKDIYDWFRHTGRVRMLACSGP